MKLSAQEEYGVRCLIQVAGNGGAGGVTIPDISRAEGISAAHAAKLLRILRRSGFVKSVRGKVGGYSLSRPAHKIILSDVLDVLGGRLFETNFCKSHAGNGKICKHSTDCSLRTLWHTVQVAVDQVLERTTLQDLLRPESEMIRWVPTLSFAISNGANSRIGG